MNDAEAVLPNDIALCHELIRQQAAALEQAQQRIEQLEHSVDLLLRQRYGPRSERVDPFHLTFHQSLIPLKLNRDDEDRLWG